MIGSIRPTRIPSRNTRRARTSGKAAHVPTTTLTIVTRMATDNVVESASWIW